MLNYITHVIRNATFLSKFTQCSSAIMVSLVMILVLQMLCSFKNSGYLGYEQVRCHNLHAYNMLSYYKTWEYFKSSSILEIFINTIIILKYLSMMSEISLINASQIPKNGSHSSSCWLLHTSIAHIENYTLPVMIYT